MGLGDSTYPIDSYKARPSSLALSAIEVIPDARHQAWMVSMTRRASPRRRCPASV